MGISYNPSIVTEGLVLGLDPQSPRFYNYKGRSVAFDGTGDRLTISSNSAFDISSGAYTVELYVNFIASPSVVVLFGLAGTSTSGNAHLLYSGGVLYWQTRGTGTNQTTYSWSPSLSRWYHLAVSWNGSNSLKLFIDGVEVASNTVSPTINQNGVNIGGASDGYSINGFISNLRIVKGTALYTSNFTPPTKPLTPVSGTSLLTCQGGAIVDNSSNKFSITKNGDARAIQSASIKFDGVNDYAPIANNSLPTGDYTINCWVKTPSVIPVTQYDVIISTSQYFWYFGIYLDKFTIDNNDGTFRFGSTLSASTWYNVTVTRSGSTDTAYINGVSQGTNTNSAALSGNWEIGRWANSPSHYWNSNIASVSIYNKALSTQEVQQNFNALRGRFGV